MKFIFLTVIVITLLPVYGQDTADLKQAPILTAIHEEKLKPKDYSGLRSLPGFSDTLLKTHFKLYEGYIKNTDAILDRLKILSADKETRKPEYAELKRRLSWELNGIILHEYYFDNLGGNEDLKPQDLLYKRITEEFGSFEKWKEDFVSTGMMRGIGWVVLYIEPRTGRLLNTWVNEHNTGNLISARPLLIMDVFEHAYMSDYQTDKEKYIASFFKTINWKTVSGRFNEKSE